MGYGNWTATTAKAFVTDTYASYGVKDLDDLAKLDTRQVYSAPTLDPLLDPRGVIRECRDSEEHPNTFPIILALDVTGSMGTAATTCAAKLNDIMTELYSKVKDVEFLMMGIGDLAYDWYPIQATQFESDVRILDQTTKIYFEGGGGGNSFESYTAAWYFGLHCTDLDCWKRGRKGIIITLGDEPLNPYLPGLALQDTLEKNIQVRLENVDTDSLYEEASKKFDIYHIAITDKESSFESYKKDIQSTWGKLLGQRLLTGSSEELPKLIGSIVEDAQLAAWSAGSMPPREPVMRGEGISW